MICRTVSESGLCIKIVILYWARQHKWTCSKVILWFHDLRGTWIFYCEIELLWLRHINSKFNIRATKDSQSIWSLSSQVFFRKSHEPRRTGLNGRLEERKAHLIIWLCNPDPILETTLCGFEREGFKQYNFSFHFLVSLEQIFDCLTLY